MGIYLSKDGISYLWSKIKNKFYIKPSTGIPKSDLASSVQTSLGKADTALQKHQDISGKVDNTAAGADSLLSKITSSWTAAPTDNTYFIRQDTSSKNEFGRVKFSTLWSYIKSKVESLGYTKNTGTITGIKMNGASKGTSGVVDLGTVITAHQDISGKQDKSTAVTHTANTAVGSATKPAYVAADGKATAITHSINADVPANAKFTDTTYPIKWVTIDANFATKFRTETKGDTTAGGFLSGLRCDTANVTGAPQYGSGIAWGKVDTHGYLYVMYDKAEAYLGGGNADRLKWIKQISFDGHTHDYLPLHGTADKATALTNGSMRYGWCVNNAENANSGYRWFRIGTMAASKNGFDTETLYLHVCEGYGGYGVLCAYTRVNSTGVGVETMRLSWLSRDSAESRSHFKLVAINSSNGVKFELWCFTRSRYEQTAYYVIADIKLTGSLLNRWVLEVLGESDAKNTTTVGTKSVTDEDLSYANTASEAATLTDSGWSSVTTYIADKSKFNNISTEFRRIGQIAWAKCSFTPNVAMTNVTICDVTKIDPFVAVTPANVVYGVGSNNDGTENFIATISYSPDRKLYLRGNFKASTIYRLMFSYPVT